RRSVYGRASLDAQTSGEPGILGGQASSWRAIACTGRSGHRRGSLVERHERCCLEALAGAARGCGHGKGGCRLVVGELDDRNEIVFAESEVGLVVVDLAPKSFYCGAHLV